MDSILKFFSPFTAATAKPKATEAAKAQRALRFNPQLQYGNENTNGLSTVGVYLDLTKPPVGGRPVTGNYVNYAPYAPRQNQNMQGVRFACAQPSWNRDCF
jgi:hypothetical protein